MARTTLAAALCAASLLFALPAAAADAVVVEIKDMKFQPPSVTVKVGTTVRWFNAEKRTNHSVLWLDDGTESERFFPEESYERTFDKPGRYAYRCGPHEEMLGEVIVEP